MTIKAIEVVPLNVPLASEYSGSYYRMVNRATIITRVVTEEGIIGEAYAGDEDSTLAQIAGIVRHEITAAGGPELRSPTSAAGRPLTRSPTTNCATSGSPSSHSRGSTSLSGTRLARRSAGLSGSSGAAVGKVSPVNIIGGYYGPDAGRIRDEVAQSARRGFAGKFKIGGREPAEDAQRVRMAREAAGDDFVITIDANQGYTLSQALDLCRRVGISTSAGSRALCLVQRPAGHEGGPGPRRHPGVRRAERVLAQRLP